MSYLRLCFGIHSTSECSRKYSRPCPFGTVIRPTSSFFARRDGESMHPTYDCASVYIQLPSVRSSERTHTYGLKYSRLYPFGTVIRPTNLSFARRMANLYLGISAMIGMVIYDKECQASSGLGSVIESVASSNIRTIVKISPTSQSRGLTILQLQLHVLGSTYLSSYKYRPTCTASSERQQPPNCPPSNRKFRRSTT